MSKASQKDFVFMASKLETMRFARVSGSFRAVSETIWNWNAGASDYRKIDF